MTKQLLGAALVLLAPVAGAFELQGTVRDGKGDPVPDASVWIRQLGDVATVLTGGDGRFRFDDVAVGFTEVVARKEGLALEGVSALIVGPSDVTICLRGAAQASMMPRSAVVGGHRALRPRDRLSAGGMAAVTEET